MAANYISDFTGQHNDDYDERIASLLNTIQAQQSTINTQNQTITSLTNRITTLESNYSTLNSLPHVIECGGSFMGGGYWQKWNTGLKEFWGFLDISNLGNYSAPISGWYGYSLTLNFPSGLFTAAPTVAYSCHASNGFALTGTITNPNKNYVNLYAVGSSPPNINGKFFIYAAGI